MRIVAAAGKDVRMRLDEPDTHTAARIRGEKLYPPEQIAAHYARQEARLSAVRANARSASWTPMPDLDPQAILRVLNRHGVRYVVIGGVAAELHNLPITPTIDIDVTPARDTKNLHRLAAAFEELEAGLATAEEGGSWFPRIPVENWAQQEPRRTRRPSSQAGPDTDFYIPKSSSRRSGRPMP